MAFNLDPHPTCANQWRHGTTSRPPAVAYVSDATNPAGPQGTPRCRSCVNSLRAANQTIVQARIVPINPADTFNDPADDNEPDDDQQPT